MPAAPTYAAIRYGYGLSPLVEVAGDAAGLLARLSGPDLAVAAFPGQSDDEIQSVLLNYDRVAKARRADRENRALSKELAKLVRAIKAGYLAGFRAALLRAAYSEDSLRERLVAFWADHFTVRAKSRRDRALPQAYVDAAVRPHVTGRFGDMLVAVVTHPVMLGYLDQNQSVGPGSEFGMARGRGLNENLAREVLELHTLGVDGDYRQADVRSFAELLTGLTFSTQDGFTFRPGLAEPGPETVLGIVYGNDRRPALADIAAALQDLALHPDTARHLARKIAVHFVADVPDQGLVDHLAATYRQSGGDLLAVYAALLDHPLAWEGFGAKAKQPFDFLVSAVRALGVPSGLISGFDGNQMTATFLGPLSLMAQPWQEPPGPDGWPEETSAWVTPQGLAGRIQWAMSQPGVLIPMLPDPRRFVVSALGDTASDKLIWAATQAATIPEGIGIVLASPEFNRR